jgi:hypothetical protein
LEVFHGARETTSEPLAGGNAGLFHRCLQG